MKNQRWFKNILGLLLVVTLLFVGRKANAVELNPEIRHTISRLYFEGESLYSEEDFVFQPTSNQSALSFTFQLLPDQSSAILQDIAIRESNNANQLLITAKKVEAGNPEPGIFSYESPVSEDGGSLVVNVYYGFEANKEYTLRFLFDRTDLLHISQDFVFFRYPLPSKTYAPTTAEYLFQIELPQEIQADYYRLQSVAETWFVDQTESLDLLQYRSEKFRFRSNQYIYVSLDKSVLPLLEVNNPELSETEFFPNQGSIQLPQNPIRDFFQNSYSVLLLAASVTVLILMFYFILEKQGRLFIKAADLDFSIFNLDAAHSAYLFKRQRDTSLILAGLLQLVQKNEVELRGQVFYWLFPEREDFSAFSSAEIFLLQWLFENNKKKPKKQKYEISAAKLNKRVEDPVFAEDFLLNFKKYCLLLREDLYKEHYLHLRCRQIGNKVYLGLGLFTASVLLLLLIFHPVPINLLLLVPCLLSFIRLRRARYFSQEGRIKVKQLELLKAEFSRPGELFRPFTKQLSERDLAPLFLPYAISLSALNVYLHHMEKSDRSKLGILDLLYLQNDYEQESSRQISLEWERVRNEILQMYYLMMESLVAAEIRTQKLI